MANELTQERLKELLSYDPDSGLFTRKVRTSNRIKQGDQAGSDNGQGYLQIRLDGKLYRSHRLAWLYVYGAFPAEIDHINGHRSDNRISNLRSVSRGENIQNSKRRKDNTSGVKGVTKHSQSGKWQAEIKAGKRRHYLGLFEPPEEAADVVAKSRSELHGEFQRHG